MSNHQTPREAAMAQVLPNAASQQDQVFKQSILTFMFQNHMAKEGMSAEELECHIRDIFRRQHVAKIDLGIDADYSRFMTQTYNPIFERIKLYMDTGATSMMLPITLKGEMLLDVIKVLQNDGFRVKVTKNEFSGRTEVEVIFQPEEHRNLVDLLIEQ